MRVDIGRGALELVVGDVCAQSVDAIVNAANARLAGGGGVDGAIHRAGGPNIMAETRRLYPGGCPPGSAVITSAGELPARHVIHAVGPIWSGGDSGEADLLAGAYRAAFALAEKHALTSLALPALSAGAYGYPLSEAARIAVATIAEVLKAAASVRLARFVLFNDEVYNAFERAIPSKKRSNGLD